MTQSNSTGSGQPPTWAYILFAVITAVGVIVAAYVGRSSGITAGQEQGKQQAFATSAVQLATGEAVEVAQQPIQTASSTQTSYVTVVTPTSPPVPSTATITSEPTAIPQAPTMTPTAIAPPPSPTTTSISRVEVGVQETHVGMNVYEGTQIPLPSEPVSPDELYVAHGDLSGNGGCEFRIWDTGETISGLSASTWQLYLLKGGSHEQRMQIVQSKQSQVPNCPMR